MQLYIGLKLVEATPMTRQAYNDLRNWVLPTDEDGSDEGYLVEYTDGGKANHKDYAGYISWSPKDVFERAYRRTDGMPFGMALEALKLGYKVARTGWNGKGMFIYYVQANKYLATSKVAREYFGEDAMVPYRDYIAMKTVDEEVVPWMASQTDMLAQDWRLV